MASVAIAGASGIGRPAPGKAPTGPSKGGSIAAFGRIGRLQSDFATLRVAGSKRIPGIVCAAASTEVLPKVPSAGADSSEGLVTVSNISKYVDTGSMKRLKALYEEEIVPILMKEFEYTNKLQVPKLEKIVVNCGVGDASQNAKALDGAKKDLSIATGQQPIVTRAKKAIAGFKVRENMAVGLATTLRGELMYSFVDRLVNLVLPRMRDFGGLNKGSFDGRGNFSLGLKEQTLFPEIPYDKIDKTRGMDITLVTSAKSDREARRLFELLGLKFREQSSAPVVKKPKKKQYRR